MSEELKKEDNEQNVKQVVKKKKNVRLIIVLAVLVLTAIFVYINYRGTYLETLEIGEQYLDVMYENIKYKYSIMAVTFIISFISIYITNRSIRKGLAEFFEEEKKEMPKLPNKSISLIFSIIISIFSSSALLNKTMLFFNVAWFGITDPIFNMDIGFYIFQKPFIESIILYLGALVLGLAIYTAAYYIITLNKFFDGVNVETLKRNKFLKQLMTFGKILIILIAAFIIVKMQGIVSDQFLTLQDENKTSITGAGITDVSIKLWGYRILAIVMVISVFMAIRAFKKGKTKKVFISLAGVPVYLVCMFIIMTGFGLIFVSGSELDKQKEYISYNIDFTKKAYGINIEEVNVEDNGTITEEEVNANSDVINNISIVSKDITLKTLNTLQTSTGYYTYTQAQINRYNINGENKLIYISPREIVNYGTSYNNKTYEYTHGYGVVVTSASTVDETGNLEYLQKDFAGKEKAIGISQPRIYFGLETNETIVTNSTKKTEFDYPISTTESAEYSYDGDAGLNLNFIDRLILATKEQDMKLAFSTSVNKESTILINRNVIERAQAIMPYLMYDEEPYLVTTNEGKLVWVLDAYTTTNQYSYSQMSTIEYDGSKQEINYIRNSIKVLIDAYDGTVTFYITDKTDPIAMAYNNMYDSLFLDGEDIPEDISSQFVYSEYLYEIQASMLEYYHSVTTDVLYRGGDIWGVATYAATTTQVTKGTEITPYYTMIKTVDNNKSTLGLILPYTPLNKQNINAYLVGTYDNNQAKLVLYKYSSDSNVLGPMQLDTQLDQDETISKEIASINVTGTKLIKNMIIVPINNTLLYVEPIYQQALNEANSIPVLKKVVVASGSKVAIGDNLKEALTNLLSQYASKIEVENTDTIEALIEAIIKANSNLTDSNDSNDWEMMGKDIEKLQSLIKQLEELQKQLDSEKTKSNTTNNTTGSNATE